MMSEPPGASAGTIGPPRCVKCEVLLPPKEVKHDSAGHVYCTGCFSKYVLGRAL